uniref:Uncharacterized protein n=1 Tax=viral metagenome TaxID=1070528 RepID=A0A6C0EM25_9ZZZZ
MPNEQQSTPNTTVTATNIATSTGQTVALGGGNSQAGHVSVGTTIFSKGNFSVGAGIGSNFGKAPSNPRVSLGFTYRR